MSRCMVSAMMLRRIRLRARVGLSAVENLMHKSALESFFVERGH